MVPVPSSLGIASLGLALLLGACGGRAAGQAADAGATDGGGAPLVDGATEADALAGCVSLSGYAICGGTPDCFPPSERGGTSDCWDCAQAHGGFYTSLCLNATVQNFQNPPADDGQVYVQGISAYQWEAVPFDVGQLFADNDAGSQVRYADWSAWTGADLPSPTSCPAFSGYSICGGNCGPCSAGQICTGRSPLHPYGLCVSTSDPGCGMCPSGQSCLAFKDSAADQALAETWGMCFPTTTCQAIASTFPGGAVCH